MFTLHAFSRLLRLENLSRPIPIIFIFKINIVYVNMFILSQSTLSLVDKYSGKINVFCHKSMLRHVTGLQLHVYMNIYWIINYCVWSWFNVISTERHSQLEGICVIKQVLFCLIMHMFSNMFCLSMLCWVNDSNLYNSSRTSSLYVNNVIVSINNHNIVLL